ncbi:MAG: macrolide ABC transporter ATP-binding protein [Verrucomicrobia bacterium]|nr:macrolide ABC transporter ATP-binding protein [Verrucomicrobiota bacterium]
MSPPTAVLIARGATKSFSTPTGPVTVLKKTELCVREGSFVIVTGPSGSGKTTFLNLAGLLDKPTSGDLEFDGESTTSMSDERLCEVRKTRIGMVFQRFHLLPHRSAVENIAFRYRYLEADAGEVRRRSYDILNALNLAGVADTPTRLLSSGEQQRVAIARAVVLRPRLLLADEPTGNLDRTATVAVMSAFNQLNRDGITVLMVTHNEALLGYASHRVMCVDGELKET